MKAENAILKAHINGLVEEKKTLTRERTKHKRKSLVEFKKTAGYRSIFPPIDSTRSSLKWEIRHHLLAYAFLRGRSYKSVERKCADDNKPSVFLIAAILKKRLRVTGRDAEVETWLNAEDSQEVEAAA